MRGALIHRISSLNSMRRSLHAWHYAWLNRVAKSEDRVMDALSSNDLMTAVISTWRSIISRRYPLHH